MNKSVIVLEITTYVMALSLIVYIIGTLIREPIPY